MNICQKKFPIIQSFFLTEEQMFIFNPLPQISFLPRRFRDPSTVRVCFPVSIKGDVDQKVQRNSWMFMYPTKNWGCCRLFDREEWSWQRQNLIGLPMKRRKKDVSKKSEQTKASEKVKTKDIKAFFSFTEK